jgi:hypothetical protein
MPDTTSALRRIEAGAIISILDIVAATTWVIKVLEPGTVEQDIGMYEVLPFTDRGEQQHPYEGDVVPGRFRLQVKYAGQHNANDLAKLLQARNTSGAAQGKVRLFNIIIKNPDSKGAATGEQITLEDAYVMPPIKIRAGAKFDMLEVEFVHNKALPATATY